MANTYTLTCTPEAAAERIRDAIEGRYFTGEMIDSYRIGGGDKTCLVLVFERHSARVGNRMTLTVTLDNLSGITRVHTVGGGGGAGLLGFDWGAAESFASCAIDAPRDAMQ